MSDTYEHNPGDHEDPAPDMTWMMGIIGTLILVVIYFGISAVYRDTTQTDTDVKFESTTVKPADVLKQEALSRINAEKGFITVENAEGEPEQRWTIPIDRSMDIMAEKLRREQSASAPVQTQQQRTVASSE